MFSKVTIIGGSGNVGSHIAYLAALRGIAREIGLYSIDLALCKGMALDISQSLNVFHIPSIVRGYEGYEEIENSDVVVISAGFPRKSGMSRDDLLLKNAEIIKDIAQNIAKFAPNAIILVVSNPLDVMCMVARHWSGFESRRVIGMAGILDSARLSYYAKDMLGSVDSATNALVIGAHSDNMLPLLAHSSIKGKSITSVCDEATQNVIVENTKNGGASIVSFYKKGSAYFAPAAGVVKMLELLLMPKDEIIPASVQANGEYGLKDLYIGLPIKLDSKGVKEIAQLQLSQKEQDMLNISADSIKNQSLILQNNALL